jgi:hypothetical protein
MKRTRFSARATSNGQSASIRNNLASSWPLETKPIHRTTSGFRRDAVVLHMQFQFQHEMGTIRLRFLVENPDALFNEYRQRGVECTPNGVRDTPWRTREFALYDLDGNALTFYRDLKSAEKELQSSWFAEATSHRLTRSTSP